MGEIVEHPKLAEQKFCKDCKWAKPEIDIVGILLKKRLEKWKYSKCLHPSHSKLDRVTGEIVQTMAYCSVERVGFGLPNECGREGKLWEKK